LGLRRGNVSIGRGIFILQGISLSHKSIEIKEMRKMVSLRNKVTYLFVVRQVNEWDFLRCFRSACNVSIVFLFSNNHLEQGHRNDYLLQEAQIKSYKRKGKKLTPGSALTFKAGGWFEVFEATLDLLPEEKAYELKVYFKVKGN
jgi:hypothetical protein